MTNDTKIHSALDFQAQSFELNVTSCWARPRRNCDSREGTEGIIGCIISSRSRGTAVDQHQHQFFPISNRLHLGNILYTSQLMSDAKKFDKLVTM